MARIRNRAPLANGNHLQLVEVGYSGAGNANGGRFRNPVAIRIVETSDTDYYSVRGVNVVRVHEEYLNVDSRRCGPNSYYAHVIRVLDDAFRDIIEIDGENGVDIGLVLPANDVGGAVELAAA